MGQKNLLVYKVCVKLHAELFLGKEKMSLLERCPRFRDILLERFHSYILILLVPNQYQKTASSCVDEKVRKIGA